MKEFHELPRTAYMPTEQHVMDAEEMEMWTNKHPSTAGKLEAGVVELDEGFGEQRSALHVVSPPPLCAFDQAAFTLNSVNDNGTGRRGNK